MTAAANFVCDHGHSWFECADNLIRYSSQFDEYGLVVHDGGSSSVLINHCPWCGAKLPESKRDRWFDTLKSKGFDEPMEQDIPEEFKSDAWRRDRE